MSDDLLNKIKADLIKSGLGSELKASKIFENAGYSVSTGCAYFDSEENKSREIDSRSTFSTRVELDKKSILYHEFHIHAEVKKCEKPWIVFKKDLDELFYGSAWNNLISAIHLPTKEHKIVEHMKKNCLLNIKKWEATGVHESFKSPSNTSKWYGAFLSAIKSSIDSCENESPNNDDNERYESDIRKNQTEIHFFQPLVIIDGKLISAELDNNDIKLEYIESAAFNFEYKTKHSKHSKFRVDLVTLEGLPSYVELCKKRQNDINVGLIEKSIFNISDCEFK